MNKFNDLQYHPDFFSEDPIIKERECNGCGPSGWLNLIIPDKICDINISFICDMHDYAYYKGKTLSDKIDADISFLYNLLTHLKRNIDLNDTKLWKKARRGAIKYFEAVDTYGYFAFDFMINKSKKRFYIKKQIKKEIKRKQRIGSNLDNNDPIKICKIQNYKHSKNNLEDDLYL